MDQKNQLIVLAVLVVGLLLYLAYSFIPWGSKSEPSNLSPRDDPASSQFMRARAGQ